MELGVTDPSHREESAAVARAPVSDSPGHLPRERMR